MSENGETTNGQIRVMIVEDHAMMRQGLKMMLAPHHDVLVVAEAADADAAELAFEQHELDVILMDVRLPRVDGVELTRRLRAKDHRPQPAIIGLSMHDEEVMQEKMRDAGATAYMIKTAPPEQMLTTIREQAGRI